MDGGNGLGFPQGQNYMDYFDFILILVFLENKLVTFIFLIVYLDADFGHFSCVESLS